MSLERKISVKLHVGETAEKYTWQLQFMTFDLYPIATEEIIKNAVEVVV